MEGHISKLPQSDFLLSRSVGCKSINFDYVSTTDPLPRALSRTVESARLIFTKCPTSQSEP